MRRCPHGGANPLVAPPEGDPEARVFISPEDFSEGLIQEEEPESETTEDLDPESDELSTTE